MTTALASHFDEFEGQRRIEQASARTAELTKKLPTSSPEEKSSINREIAEAGRSVDQLATQFPASAGVQDASAAFSLQTNNISTAKTRADIAVELARTRSDSRLLARTLITRALTAAAEHDYAKAEADARAALQADPGNRAAEAVVKLTQERSRVKTKLDARLETPLLDDEPLQRAMALARAQAAINRPAGFAKSVALTKAAETGLKLDDYERMRDAASAALKKLPNNPRAYMDRAFANLMLKRYDAAQADADAGLKLKPDAASLLSLRAAAKLERGDARGAYSDADKASAVDPKDPFARVQRGLAGERLGLGEDKYLADLKSAAELNPAFDHYYEEALARRGLAPAAKAGGAAAAATPWWASPAAMGAGLIALFVVLAVGAAILLRPAATPRPGVVGGCFKLGRQIGSGGMGAVYEAWDENLERPVAVKRMNELTRGDAGDAARFVQEAKTVASLKHPNIVSIYDAFQDRGELYLVFELVGGETLEDALERRGPLLPAQALRLLGPICEALDYAHARGVIHRDLKPSNVMIEDGNPKLMDFGIARRTRNPDGRTNTRTVAGTPAYMAPEARRGEVSRATDVYALGLCAYRMLTGSLPPGGAPGPFEPALGRALDADPSRRYRSAGEFFAALRDAVPA